MGDNCCNRRVVVTGTGMVTPIGLTTDESWSNCTGGVSGIGPITQFDASDFATQIAGEVKEFDPLGWFSKKEVRKFDRFIHLAVAAADMALKDSGLEITDELSPRTGVVMGVGMGGLTSIAHHHKSLIKSGPRRMSPFFIPMVIANMAPGEISILFNAKGPNTSVVTACAAGTHGIGEAFKLIQRGAADAMITGGVESVVNDLAIGGFNAMRALSTRNDEPERASRPFDVDRDGFVMSEGAGVLILEEAEMAEARGARIIAEVVGYGLTGDAHHIAAPAPEGDGMARCMQMCLDDAGVDPPEVDYINAHGTSTDLNDLYETIAIKTVFRDHAYKTAISSTKSMTGHILGGAGGVESCFTILAIRDSIAPPTINLDNQDPECDLDYVPEKARKMNIDVAMNNSFGFGGTNAALLFKRYAP